MDDIFCLFLFWCVLVDMFVFVLWFDVLLFVCVLICDDVGCVVYVCCWWYWLSWCVCGGVFD